MIYYGGSMEIEKVVQDVKHKIVQELFTDVDSKRCVVDIYIEQNGKMDINKLKMHKVSQIFLEQSMDELSEEHNKGQILFFRKYAYEKILNKYLQDRFHVTVELDLFPSEKKKTEEQERQKEINILNSISSLKWEKTIRVDSIIYSAKYSNGICLKLELKSGVQKHKNDDKKRLFYDNKALEYVDYDVKELVKIIENTHPKEKKAENIFVVTNKAGSDKTIKTKKKQKDNLVRQIESTVEAKDKFNQVHMNTIQKIAKNYKLDEESVCVIILTVQKRCPYYKYKTCVRMDNTCFPYYRDCMFYDEFNRKLVEKSKQVNCNRNNIKRKTESQNTVNNTVKNIKQEDSNSLKNNVHQIGLKKLVVRANVFKCMHNKHKIDNVVAVININHDGKNQQVKISAGYCSQCDVYFILDSTYENLKKKGMILCRVTDEKNYMKGSYINGMHLAQESILMQYGYNVSQTEGLSSTGRQKILAVIIDNKIMSKSEIISYLDFFISQRSSIPRMEVAISKWEADREFVENYRIGEYSQFGVNAIYRR